METVYLLFTPQITLSDTSMGKNLQYLLHQTNLTLWALHLHSDEHRGGRAQVVVADQLVFLVHVLVLVEGVEQAAPPLASASRVADLTNLAGLENRLHRICAGIASSRPPEQEAEHTAYAARDATDHFPGSTHT